jgi:hypothetical protein
MKHEGKDSSILTDKISSTNLVLYIIIQNAVDLSLN